jgi:hypothetical protein
LLKGSKVGGILAAPDQHGRAALDAVASRCLFLARFAPAYFAHDG